MSYIVFRAIVRKHDLEPDFVAIPRVEESKLLPISPFKGSHNQVCNLFDVFYSTAFRTRCLFPCPKAPKFQFEKKSGVSQKYFFDFFLPTGCFPLSLVVLKAGPSRGQCAIIFEFSRWMYSQVSASKWIFVIITESYSKQHITVPLLFLSVLLVYW